MHIPEAHSSDSKDLPVAEENRVMAPMNLNDSRALILVVDDDLAFLKALPDMLRLRLPQVNIDTCASASEALTQLMSTDYHVIISDVKMPGMGGIGLLREASKIRPLTPFILITGHGDDAMAAEALGLGAYLFIRKPLDRDAFSLSIQRGLEAYDLRKRVEKQESA
jgi:DNA-binding NtrC family response regulator